MWNKRLVGVALATAILGTACLDESEAGPTATDAVIETQAVLAAEVANTGALRGTSELGEILVGSNGLTLYGFTNDVDARSACYGTCAEAWPPVIVGPEWTVGPDLDSGIFNTITRDDGRLQLVAGKWPLYHYAGDSAPGQINGHGSGDVWFVVDVDGALLPLPPTEAVAQGTTTEVADDVLSGVTGDDGSVPGEMVADELEPDEPADQVTTESDSGGGYAGGY